jgi:hypothetical protein
VTLKYFKVAYVAGHWLDGWFVLKSRLAIAIFIGTRISGVKGENIAVHA